MSAIDSQTFASAFLSAGSPVEPGGAQRDARNAARPASAPVVSDEIWSVPSQRTLPYDPPTPGSPAPAAPWDFSGMMRALMNAISALFAQLGGMLGSGGSLPVPAAPAPKETRYADATCSSVGDPHDAFAGTTSAGAVRGDTWNDMHSHGDLLDSDSFAGGYRVSTTVTQPNAKGITMNQRATVATGGGAVDVSLAADGSYAVSDRGHALTLQTGRPTSLGNGETVTLEPDRSLTIQDANGAGGSIETTLRAVRGGVDVATSAHDVDLGGYLVDRRDGAAPVPVNPFGPDPSSVAALWTPGGEAPIALE